MITGRSEVQSTGRPWRRALRQVLEGALERSPLAGKIFWRLPAAASGVALTFDDGPHPEITPRVLDLLAAADVRATFFVIGEQAARYPEIVRRMAREGHQVGNHTLTHARCSELSAAELLKELEATQGVLESLGAGSASPLFRPPFGVLRPGQVRACLATGYRIAFWSRDSRDYRQAPAESIAATASALQPRDVLLLHDRFENTLAGLPGLLEGLSSRGLNAVALPETGALGSRLAAVSARVAPG